MVIEPARIETRSTHGTKSVLILMQSNAFGKCCMTNPRDFCCGKFLSDDTQLHRSSGSQRC